jgi:polyketide cyclase/dehydrase/lipid transport protein
MRYPVIIKALLGLAAVALVFSFFVSRQPDTFHVERSISVGAPAERAFAQVNDFRAWRAWSPYEKLDPEMMRLFGGPATGEGASYTWAGNRQIGEGRMTIERSVPGERIDIRLDFIEPFENTCQATFSFAPTPEGTKVTWAMDGHNNFAGKAMHLFMDFDTMIATQFDSGLQALKALAETNQDAQAVTSAR